MANVPSGLYEVDPVSRIEGHLGVKVKTDGAADGATVTEAWAHGNLWRGFENFLIGRNTNDAITFTQRICGVCPLPHATASTFATESVLGVSDGYITFATTSQTDEAAKGVPPKAVLIRNLTYSAEFLMSAITHFYHLAAPSYVQGPNMPPWTPYFNESQYSSFLLSDNMGTGTHRAVPTIGAGADTAFSADLWSAVIKQYVKALRVRRLTFEGGALFAGRMPMISSYVAGGVTNEKNEADFASRCDAFKTAMTKVGEFIFKEYVPLVLALGALYPEWDNVHNDFSSVTAIGKPGRGYGAGCQNFLAWGAFPGGVSGDANNTMAFKGGYLLSGQTVPTIFMSGISSLSTAKNIVETKLVEYITRSRYANSYEYTTVEKAYPGSVSYTEPVRDMSGKYSWLKAPRLTVGSTDYPMEVGPMARMYVMEKYKDGQPILSTFGVAGLYTKTVGSDTGLDPALIEPDLAVALVRSDFAKLKVGTTLVSHDGAGAGETGINTLTSGDIVSNYTNSNAVILNGDSVPLVTYLTTMSGGFSTMDRLRCRGLEAAYLVQQMIGGARKTTGALTFDANPGWIDGLKLRAADDGYKHYTVPAGTVSGYGVSEAPRGALAHFCTSTNGRITKYQCVVPTTWNASPKSGPDPSPGGYSTVRGPMEQSMIGVPFDAAATQYTPTRPGGPATCNSGVEVLRVAQSFDPCIACAVH